MYYTWSPSFSLSQLASRCVGGRELLKSVWRKLQIVKNKYILLFQDFPPGNLEKDRKPDIFV